MLRILAETDSLVDDFCLSSILLGQNGEKQSCSLQDLRGQACPIMDNDRHRLNRPLPAAKLEPFPSLSERMFLSSMAHSIVVQLMNVRTSTADSGYASHIASKVVSTNSAYRVGKRVVHPCARASPHGCTAPRSPHCALHPADVLIQLTGRQMPEQHEPRVHAALVRELDPPERNALASPPVSRLGRTASVIASCRTCSPTTQGGQCLRGRFRIYAVSVDVLLLNELIRCALACWEFGVEGV